MKIPAKPYVRQKTETFIEQIHVSEEDICLQIQAVQDIVKHEVEKKLEKERKEEEEKRRTEQMVREREEREWEENWAEEEQSALQALYNREREIEMEIGVQDADAMAWEEEVERHFEDHMSRICKQYEAWHQRTLEEVAENRRIEEVECDRT